MWLWGCSEKISVTKSTGTSQIRWEHNERLQCINTEHQYGTCPDSCASLHHNMPALNDELWWTEPFSINYTALIANLLDTIHTSTSLSLLSRQKNANNEDQWTFLFYRPWVALNGLDFPTTIHTMASICHSKHKMSSAYKGSKLLEKECPKTALKN